MAETIITVTGNLTEDPSIRYTQSGVAVVSFSVASTPRTFDRASGEWRDGDTLFLRCSAWRDMAENIAGSLSKGMAVIAQGKLRQKSYEKDGQTHTYLELEVEEIGPSLRWATAEVTRSSGSRTQSEHRDQAWQAQQSQESGWATSEENPPW